MRMTFDEPIADVPEDRAAVEKPTKECPFCAETILAKAIKCRHCGEFLIDRPTPPPFQRPGGQASQAPKKWYHSTLLLIVAIVTLGPLALPMVWTNPRYNPLVKLIVTVGVIALTIGLCYVMVLTYRNLINQVESLGL